jgi:hypothetical protein
MCATWAVVDVHGDIYDRQLGYEPSEWDRGSRPPNQRASEGWHPSIAPRVRPGREPWESGMTVWVSLGVAYKGPT